MYGDYNLEIHRGYFILFIVKRGTGVRKYLHMFEQYQWKHVGLTEPRVTGTNKTGQLEGKLRNGKQWKLRR